MERVPQGILGRPDGRFELTRHEPAPPLRPFVQYYWVVRWDRRGLPSHEQRVLPNLSVHVSFSRGASGVWPPSRDVFSYVLAGEGQVLGARFRPGCFRSLLGAPLSSLGGKPRPLESVFGPSAHATEAAILAADSGERMAGLADELLASRVPALSEAERRARDAVETIAADPALTTVARLATATGTSVRTLQRIFADCVGVSPKWAIRVYRLNDAAKRVATDPDLGYATLAAELGYSDQAHFTRDFTAAVGTPPAAYARGGNRGAP